MKRDADATRHPRLNDTICVRADTCGRTAMATVTKRKKRTEGCFHHTFLNDGVLSPASANMKFDAPITSAEEANHERDASTKAVTTLLQLRTEDGFRNISHSERQLAARWNMLA